MKWNWIDEENQIINVICNNEFTTKSKKERIIPINPAISRILTYKGKNRDNYVFTRNKKTRLNEDFVSKQFKDVIKSIGFNDRIHFHTLRHSFASILVQKGVHLPVIKGLLGHSDLSTTQIYAHLKHENLFDAVNVL